MANEDFFGSDFDNAKPLGRPENFPNEGVFLVTVDRLVADTSKSDGKKYFVMESIVLESDNPSVRPGEVRSFFQSIYMKNFVMVGAGNVRQLMAALIGATFEQITAKFAALASGSDQPLRGMPLIVKTRPRHWEGKEYANYSFIFHENLDDAIRRYVALGGNIDEKQIAKLKKVRSLVNQPQFAQLFGAAEVPQKQAPRPAQHDDNAPPF
jgi:hypothetical protein